MCVSTVGPGSRALRRGSSCKQHERAGSSGGTARESGGTGRGGEKPGTDPSKRLCQGPVPPWGRGVSPLCTRSAQLRTRDPRGGLAPRQLWEGVLQPPKPGAPEKGTGVSGQLWHTQGPQGSVWSTSVLLQTQVALRPLTGTQPLLWPIRWWPVEGLAGARKSTDALEEAGGTSVECWGDIRRTLRGS